MTTKTKTEYRMVMARPEHLEGAAFQHKPKRDWGHARDSLAAWGRDMQRYIDAGLTPWHAWIEEREVTDWTRVDLTVEAP